MYSVDQLLASATLFVTVMGVVLSWLLEKAPAVKDLWAKIPTGWKPWALFLFIELVSVVPVFAHCLGATGWVMEILNWVPSVACSLNIGVFALAIRFVTFTTSQFVFFKILDGTNDK